MCSEVQNIGAIDFTKRGKKAIVAPGFGKMLIETGCVGCGQCAAVCPTGALTINRQIPEMWRMLNDPNKRVVVQFAPSVRVGLAEEFGMPANEPVTGKLRLGDVDCNGIVDVTDAVLLARLLAEDGEAVVSQQGMRNADCNQDGSRSMDDTTLILQHVAKLRLLPEIEE